MPAAGSGAAPIKAEYIMEYTILKIKGCYCDGKPLFIGSPAMKNLNGRLHPHYTTNINEAGCFTPEEREEALNKLPLIRGAFEFITDIEEYQEREYYRNLNEYHL